MYYEFYIDQFAAEQFLSGTLLLAITVRLLGRPLRWRRILAGSMVSTTTMVLLICAGVPSWYPVSILIAAVTVFYERDRGKLGKSICAMLFVTICFGGTLDLVISLLGIPKCVGIAASGAAVYLMMACLKKRRAGRRVLLSVILQWEEHRQRATALVDTGNQLREPLTGRPVSIVDAETAEELLGRDWERRRGFYLIPYRSLGTECGWMRGVTIDCMYLEQESGLIPIEAPILAIYEGRVSAGGQYQVILHGEHAG